MLKIKVDLQCQVYCDFEHVGEAFPDSMFKMELRKGTYILDFKINGAIGNYSAPIEVSLLA